MLNNILDKYLNYLYNLIHYNSNVNIKHSLTYKKKVNIIN